MVDRFIVVDTVSGRTEAEFLLSFLEARGIQCELSQEAIGWVFGIGVGPLSEVDILVPSHQGKQAREALKEYHKAKHKNPVAHFSGCYWPAPVPIFRAVFQNRLPALQRKVHVSTGRRNGGSQFVKVTSGGDRITSVLRNVGTTLLFVNERPLF